MLKKNKNKNKQVSICKNCKYLGEGLISFPNGNTSTNISYVCTLELVKEQQIDPVSGQKSPFTAIACYQKNNNGQCEDFEEVGIFKKIYRFFSFGSI